MIHSDLLFPLTSTLSPARLCRNVNIRLFGKGRGSWVEKIWSGILEPFGFRAAKTMKTYHLLSMPIARTQKTRLPNLWNPTASPLRRLIVTQPRRGVGKGEEALVLFAFIYAIPKNVFSQIMDKGFFRKSNFFGKKTKRIVPGMHSGKDILTEDLLFP